MNARMLSSCVLVMGCIICGLALGSLSAGPASGSHSGPQGEEHGLASILSALEATRAKIEAIGTLAGAKTEHLEGYHAWSPNLESPLLETMKTVYKDLTGKDAEIMAIHAGLECGIIGDKFPGMDMISFGPELKNPHSPDEKVNIGSVERFWDFLLATLKALL